jgi:hypothetical protein
VRCNDKKAEGHLAESYNGALNRATSGNSVAVAKLFIGLTSMNANDNHRLVFWGGVLLGLALSGWYAINQVVDGDQLQMIHRGYLGAHHGVWMAIGNTASAVGNVPGFLSAWVVGAPLLVWDSPYAPMVLLILLRLAGFLMLDAVVRQVFPQSWLARLVFLLLCWLNPWFLFDSLLYNPAYLIFCAGLHAWTAWHLQSRPSFWLTFLHVLSVGIAMQLHFSWPLLVFLSAYLFYRGALKLNWFAVALCIILLIGSLIPYVMTLMAAPELAQHVDPKARERYIGRGFVHVYPVLKSVIYWVRYGSWAFPSKLVNDTEFLWIATLWLQWTSVGIWRIFMYGLATVTFVASLTASVLAFSQVKNKLRRRDGPIKDASDWLLVYAFGAFVAMLISAGLAPIVFNYWHLALIFPFALFPMLHWVVRHVYRGSERHTGPLYVIAAILVLINVVAINDSRKFSWSADYSEQVIQYVNESVKAPGK